jgi:bacteriocin-like protein
MSETNDISYEAAAKSERELTEAELNHVSGGTPPKQEAVFPTETIKFTYGAIEWTPKG